MDNKNAIFHVVYWEELFDLFMYCCEWEKMDGSHGENRCQVFIAGFYGRARSV
jgi:hypothetical protein